MKPTDQIAAELDHALIEFSRKKYPVLSQRERKKTRIAIIQSAIKKATEELRGANDELFKIKQRVVIENKQLRESLKTSEAATNECLRLLDSRAAHASEGKGKP